jgi:hypothetical protein
LSIFEKGKLIKDKLGFEGKSSKKLASLCRFESRYIMYK